MKIGIDKYNFYIPKQYIEMRDLAEARQTDPNKYLLGLGQDQQAFAPLSQDTVSMAANAAAGILTDQDKETIDLVILATESGIDQSKAGAIYIHHLLGINPKARCIEVKEACYGGTFALQTAVNHIVKRPQAKALVLTSDIARYGLNTAGEATQGAGAVALLITADPRILSVNDDASYYTIDVMDFWRPNYSRLAHVDGHYSNDQYLNALDQVWADHQALSGHQLDDFAAFSFHLPYTKLGLKGLKHLTQKAKDEPLGEWEESFEASRAYNRRVGNIYTGSLYLSLISLLENDASLKAGDLIGLYSYGSGAMAEFFSMNLEANYQDYLEGDKHRQQFAERQKLSIPEYEALFQEDLLSDGSQQSIPAHGDQDDYRLLGLKDHKRIYGK
ncbi:hydroxymethylglutaryl-CoA synthase [Aerococcus tenax]|uniref:hydroxymethylglutaryl-CoA synthase n=1 Tax=Aerococcus tenax TaxID=3078812 RepID=UPI0018A7D92D|nr:hydroxymethylglutaryl-CoA synthase [Aerococcus tenax]